MKRFWTRAEATIEPGGFGVRLDGRAVRLPPGDVLLVPTAPLAEAIAAEWQVAGIETQTMEYADVPLTRLAGTAQLRIVADPSPAAAAIAVYGETDLLCYQVSTPPVLRERQSIAWTPWLDWARVELGAPLTITTGLAHVPQHPAALAALRRSVDQQGAWRLAGLGIVVPALGSVVLGLAVARGCLKVSAAHALARVEESYQAEQWGEDDLAVERRADIEADLLDAARFMDLLG